PAILRGYRLTFDKIPERGPEGSGYATLAADPGGVVEGVLYQEEDTDLGKLDVCEGYPEHYTRQTCKVALADGTLVNAVTDVANPRHVGEGLRPTREYLRHLWAGTDMVSESYRRMLRGITPYSGSGAGSGRDRQARRGGARRAQG